jgi:hypothetical protein
MLTVSDLQDYYKQTYNHIELAALLAQASLTGDLPVIPDQLHVSHPVKKRGRPSTAQWSKALSRLHTVLVDHYPRHTDLATLGHQSGISLKALVKLQSNLAFLTTLPANIGEWFTRLQDYTRTHLSPVWRGVLDLHIYALHLAQPGSRLPVYRQHAALWQLPLNPSAAWATQRDGAERARVFRPEFKALLEQAGWPQLQPPLSTPDEGEWPCTTGCPLIQAWVAKTDLIDIEQTRQLLGDLPWLPAQRYYLQSHTHKSSYIIAQLIGVS